MFGTYQHSRRLRKHHPFRPCANAIIENNAHGAAPVKIYPSLDLKITDKNGKTVFSNQTKMTQKSIAYTLENAQKKAYPLLSRQADKENAQKLNQ